MTNPLLQPWTGPLGGVPPYDQVKLEHFEPAVNAALDAFLAEARAIRDNSEPPTLENTLGPFDDMGTLRSRVYAVYFVWSSSLSSPAFREIEARLAPRIAAMHSQVFQDAKLYERFQAVANSDTATAEERRLLDDILRGFRRAGAHLGDEARTRVAAINGRLSVLYTTFDGNVLADEEGITHFLSEGQLGGLHPSFRQAARAAAEDAGQPDKWAIPNTRSFVQPFLKTSTQRELREQVWRAFYSRADNGDAHDNNALVSEVLSLRAERAQILGFPNHAAMVLEPNMAQTPDNAFALMRQVWDAGLGKLQRELEALGALAADRGDGLETLQPWDVRFYAELQRKAEHDFDPGLLAPHLQLDKLRDAMFWSAQQLYGWRFEAVDVPVLHPDVRAWKVVNRDGTDRGLFYFDPFARKGKRSGAWMSAYRSQCGRTGDLPIVSNNCNFTKPAKGQPALLSLDDAETLFHEFGHALHGLASEVKYRNQSGTSVARDFVEFPSQLHEHWLTTDEILQAYALHTDTQEPPPQALLERLDAARKADTGFTTMEFMASAVVDMEMHATTDPIDPATFEKETLERWGLPPQVVMRHRTPHFSHLFSGEAYSAGYYAYLWADVLTADAAAAFAEQGFYNQELAQKLFDEVLSQGGSVDPAEAYFRFRGREPEVTPLLVERGLAEAPV